MKSFNDSVERDGLKSARQRPEVIGFAGRAPAARVRADTIVLSAYLQAYAANMAVERDGCKLRLQYPPLRSGRPSPLR
ncbi:MAG: hypothetical protein JWL63_784 [Rhodocyclales bacterium]|nr:hypothetical protein [Rhodocyclales bacterium]